LVTLQFYDNCKLAIDILARIAYNISIGGLTPLRIRKTCRTLGVGGWRATEKPERLAGLRVPVVGGQQKNQPLTEGIADLRGCYPRL
jgi:hypothetical protein